MDIYATIDSLVSKLDSVTEIFDPAKKLRQKLDELDAIFEEMAKRSNSLHQIRKGDIKEFEVKSVKF